MTNPTDPIDEVFGVRTPIALDITKIERYFKDVENAVRDAVKTVKYSDDETALAQIGEIDNQLSWVADDLYRLFQFYDEAQDVIADYRSIIEKRMTDDEQHELNTIMVRNKLENTK